MKVFGVDCKDGDPTIHFATKREALDYARALTPPEDETIDVEEITLVPLTRAAVVKLLNVEGGYVEASRVIARFPGPAPQEEA